MSVICINIAKSEMEGSHRPQGSADMAQLITGNDVLLNVDDDVAWQRIRASLEFCSAYSKSFKVIDENLGVALEVTRR